MKRTNAAAATLLAIVVAVGVLALRFRPALPSHPPIAPAQAAAPAYPPASIDGRLEAAPPGRTVELCGYGSFEITPERRHPPHLAAAAELALAQAIAALADSGEPLQRTAARYLQATDAALRARAGYAARVADCDDSEDCRRKADDAAWRAFARSREALVADALATRDAAAHALAFYACLKGDRDAWDEGSCKRVSAAQWAELDADNLMAWIHAAWAAQNRGDDAARAEALRRAAQASGSRLYLEAVLAPLGHAHVRNLGPAARSIAQEHALGVRAAMPLSGLRVLSDECPSQQPAPDDARRAWCDAIGRTLADRGATLREMALGLGIGERAGWPDHELRALRDRRDAYQQVLTDHSEHWTCSYQQQLDQYTLAVLDGSGELQFAERQVKASGYSPAELARQWRVRSVPQAR